MIVDFLNEHPIGEAFIAPYDVLLSNSDIVQPDILVVLNENKEIITEKNIVGTPDFVVEILSPSNRRHDVKRKRLLYEKYGVKEYWIVDPDLETIQKFVLKDQLLVDAGTFEGNVSVVSEVITGLNVVAEKVFDW